MTERFDTFCDKSVQEIQEQKNEGWLWGEHGWRSGYAVASHRGDPEFIPTSRPKFVVGSFPTPRVFLRIYSLHKMQHF